MHADPSMFTAELDDGWFGGPGERNTDREIGRE